MLADRSLRPAGLLTLTGVGLVLGGLAVGIVPIAVDPKDGFSVPLLIGGSVAALVGGVVMLVGVGANQRLFGAAKAEVGRNRRPGGHR